MAKSSPSGFVILKKNEGIVLAVDVDHLRGFLFPVVLVVLDDAEGIDPQVADAEFPRQFYCVLEARGKQVPRNEVQSPPKAVFLRDGFDFYLPPAMAETYVGADLASRLN
ncbi:hypothetical protein CGRA01v4_13803 [Colletotrichum graminicola]|nr:hypothetical protein CGRA01v4_13803 [Colletotrichum graminicola]